MRSQRVIHTVESHTEGMPTRVVTGGVGVIPGATMAERRQWFMENSDELRTFLMYEPRGHAARRNRRDPCRGQLDGQRQAVEAPADLDHGRMLAVDVEAGRDDARPVDEQGHGL